MVFRCRPYTHYKSVTEQTEADARWLDGVLAFRLSFACVCLCLFPGVQGDDNSMAAIYGMAASLPAGPVNVLLRAYTDVTLGP